RAVGHVFHHVPVGTDSLQQQAGQLLVAQLGPAADVVDLAGAAAVEHQLDSPAVVVDMQPVAHVAAVAVQRHRLAVEQVGHEQRDRKSTRLNSSHVKISYAVFCLKKKTKKYYN